MVLLIFDVESGKQDSGMNGTLREEEDDDEDGAQEIEDDCILTVDVMLNWIVLKLNLENG